MRPLAGIGLAILATVCSRSLAAQTIPAMGHRASAWVAATPGFEFHSDFWLNLHDYLYGIAGGGDDPRAGFAAERSECFGALDRETADPWEAAVAHYRTHMGERHHRTDPLMRSVRYHLTGLAPVHDPIPDLFGILALLRGAAPGYRSCLWEQHDARNRQRIGEFVAILAVHGPILQRTLEHHYEETWPTGVPVDVVSYSDYAGANTASGRTIPSHTTISSVKPEMEGWKGVELLLHEATHTMFGANWGRVTEHLLAAAASLDTRVPRNLWHGLSFYTSGHVVQEAAHAAGESSFVPYALRRGMYDGPYRGYLEPIQQHWQPYLDGRVEMTTAVASLMRALTAR